MHRHSLLRTCAAGALALAYAAVAPAKTLYPTNEFVETLPPVGVVTADVNGDGKPDVVVNHGGFGVAVYLGRGGDKFSAPSDNYIADATGIGQSVAVGDVNGDGKPDLVVANGTSNDVTVLLGNGDGTFKGKTLSGSGTAAPTFAVGANPVFVALADVNGDGKLDIITANFADGTISVLIGKGDGTFQTQLPFVVGTGPDCIAVADVDGDGKPDLLVLDALLDSIVVLSDYRNGVFQAVTPHSLGRAQHGTQTQSFAVGDINHDGHADIVVTLTGASTRSIKVLLGDGKGGFDEPGTLYRVGLEPDFVTLADVDQDGNPDILVVNGADSTLSVLLGKGDGTFHTAQTFAANGVSGSEILQSLAVGNFDGDGFPDVVFPFVTHRAIRLLKNDGQGGFHPVNTYLTGRTPVAVATADLNGDHHADLVVTDSSDDDVSVFLGNGNGTLQASVKYATGKDPQALALADVNGDGTPDIVAANFGDGTISVLLGNGDGTFQPRQDFAAGTNLVAMTVADVDGDGTPDILVGNGISNRIGILYGRGDGTFHAPVFHQAGVVLDALAVGDVNGDGHPDIVVAGSAVNVLLNNGHGGFQPGARYLVHGFHVALADLNHDARPDIVLSDFNNSSLDVLLGNGDGSFQAPVSYPTGTAPLGMTLVDVNGDGDPDAVVAASSGASVAVMLGNGRGGFLGTSYPAEFGPRDTAVADFDEDGTPDLAVVNENSNTLNLILQHHGVVIADQAPKATSVHAQDADGKNLIGGFLGATDKDRDDALTFGLVTPAANGVALVDPVTGAFTYQANAGFTGLDSFEFQATDSMKLSNRAVISITVLTNTAGKTGGGGGGFGLLPLLCLLLLFPRRFFAPRR